jgi:pimeloyl-ACP methyl ester carboxylesterase
LFPERVDRLVLVATGGLGRELNLILRSATLPGAEPVLSVLASAPVLSRVEALGRGASKIGSKLGWRPGADIGAIWRGFSSLADRESRHAFLTTTRAVIDIGGQRISAYEYLEDVQPIPTLIVWGSKDRMIPAWHALSAQRPIPDCQVELFEGAGHFPHLDDPDRFARVLREFIAAGVTEDQPNAAEG